jgi:mannan endo-1,4-beta-mannosidase
VYDAKRFQGLDYVVASAGRHGVRLVLCLGNFWDAYQVTPDNFLRWANPGGWLMAT